MSMYIVLHSNYVKDNLIDSPDIVIDVAFDVFVYISYRVDHVEILPLNSDDV